MIHLKKSPECCSQFSSNFWPGNALPLGDGSGGITTGMFLQRCTESFNPMSTQFFPFYSQQLWGLCVYLYSPHATLPRGERRTAEILHSYKILPVPNWPAPQTQKGWAEVDTTHPSCQWILTLISSRPARHAGARQWLFLRDTKPCPSTSSHTLVPFLHCSELLPGELAYFKPPAHKVTVSASRLHHIVFSPAFLNLVCYSANTWLYWKRWDIWCFFKCLTHERVLCENVNFP